jgi:hypothetical protein
MVEWWNVFGEIMLVLVLMFDEVRVRKHFRGDTRAHFKFHSAPELRRWN